MEDISIISMAATAILALGCLYLVVMPLIKKDTLWKGNSKLETSASEKEALLTTLNEIEFEHKMHKISEKDYKILKKQYETQISRILKEEEQQVGKNVDADLLAEVDREIEEAIKTFKRPKGES